MASLAFDQSWLFFYAVREFFLSFFPICEDGAQIMAFDGCFKAFGMELFSDIKRLGTEL